MPEEKKKTERVPMMRYIPRKPLPRYYCLARVRKLYKMLWNFDVIDITPYKGTRYGKHKVYRVEDHDTGEIIEERISLFELGFYLDNHGLYNAPFED